MILLLVFCEGEVVVGSGVVVVVEVVVVELVTSAASPPTLPPHVRVQSWTVRKLLALPPQPEYLNWTHLARTES
jgi:hypothetical protein